jgi:4-alpha-glucanotransferase
LAEDGWLDARTFSKEPRVSKPRVDFCTVTPQRELQLRAAFAAFREGATGRDSAQLEAFREAQRAWLDDHALYMAEKRAHGGAAWWQWEPALRDREPDALARAHRDQAEEIAYHVFVQFQFDRHWRALVEAAREHEVALIGDVPFYVEHDSADVWARREIFQLDELGQPRLLSGVAPDYFSADGQLWGNPIYDWNALERSEYRWWIERLARALDLFDLVRLDHFIAFHRAWAVPAGSLNARIGEYLPGPGAKLFDALRAKLGGLPFIAEDLGTLVPEVHHLRDRFDLPGMRVLQFCFGGDSADDSRPFAFPRRAVVYTGTHDNDTGLGWFRERGGRPNTRTRAQAARERANVLRYSGTNGKEIHWDLIRLAFMSAADTAVVPLQDVLGLGSGARMNRPGTAPGNWEWRLRERELGRAAITRLREMTETYGRASAPRT